MATARKNIDRRLKIHHEWIAGTAQEIFDEGCQWIDADVSEGTVQSLRGMPSSLHHLAMYYGTRSVVGVTAGDPASWDEVYLGVAYHLHELRLRFLLWTRLGDEAGFTLDTSRIACGLCFAIANGLADWAKLFTEMLDEASWNRQMVVEAFWDERVFEPFVLWLAKLESTGARAADIVPESLGPFSTIVGNWNSPARFAEALSSICDYHCDNMDDNRDDDWEAEFDEPPFDLIPWEVVAIRAIRERLDLPTPMPDHPLLASLNMFAPRDELPVDERLNAIDDLRLSLGMTLRP